MKAAEQALARQAEDALRRRDRAALAAAATKLIRQRVALGAGWKLLATTLLEQGELSLARAAADAYVRGGGTAAKVEAATIYARSGRIDVARTLIAQVGRDVPDRASNAYLRGTLALNAGDLDGARDALLEAAVAMPRSGQIWQTLTSTGSMRESPAIVDRLLAAAPSMAAASDADRAAYHYAVGKALADVDETAEAFAAFDAGARLLFAARGYDAATDAASAATKQREWTAATIASLTIGSQVARSPIIVTGMPRSGSTLVEHILASHSAVAGGEELMCFSAVVREIGGADLATVGSWLRHHSLEEARALYLHLAAERFGQDGRIVDKTLETSRYLGLLAATLPDVPIVWMRRDALDCAWSCFRTYFLLGLGWTYAQEAIAAHMRLEDRLRDHWQEVLGDRLLIVDYEALVQDKEAEIPRLLRHCGLTIEPQTLSPEKTRRTVVTASVAQVRAPIHGKAVKAAAPYRLHLQPFIDAYRYEG